MADRNSILQFIIVDPEYNTRCQPEAREGRYTIADIAALKKYGSRASPRQRVVACVHYGHILMRKKLLIQTYA